MGDDRPDDQNECDHNELWKKGTLSPEKSVDDKSLKSLRPCTVTRVWAKCADENRLRPRLHR